MALQKQTTKIIAVCLGILLLAAALGFLLLGYFHIEKSVLICSRTELSLMPEEEGEPLPTEFSLLQNAGDQRIVHSVAFPEITGLTFYKVNEGFYDDPFEEQPGKNESMQMGFYKVTQLYLAPLENRGKAFLAELESPVTLKKAVICYQDGGEETAYFQPLVFNPPGGSETRLAEPPFQSFGDIVKTLREWGEL